ncbi:unnamed protein product [Malus baccata var. baccata]
MGWKIVTVLLLSLLVIMVADGFHHIFNGKKFSPGEAKCAIFCFLHSVDYTDSAEIARTPPEECTPLEEKCSCITVNAYDRL